MNTRSYLVTADIKRKGFRKVVIITITDGANTMKMETVGGFELDTDQPLSQPVIRQFR